MNSLEYPITGSNKNQRLNEEESRSEDIEDEEKGCQQQFIYFSLNLTELKCTCYKIYLTFVDMIELRLHDLSWLTIAKTC